MTDLQLSIIVLLTIVYIFYAMCVVYTKRSATPAIVTGLFLGGVLALSHSRVSGGGDGLSGASVHGGSVYGGTSQAVSRSELGITSHNILADSYTQPTFAHLPPNIISWPERQQKLIDMYKSKAIAGGADIICLQEVEAKHFDEFKEKLCTALYDETGNQYGAFYVQRATGPKSVSHAVGETAPDGVAMFYSRKFRPVEHKEIYYDQFRSPDSQYKSHRVGLIVVFKWAGVHFVVATTHLHFDTRMLKAETPQKRAFYEHKLRSLQVGQIKTLEREVDTMQNKYSVGGVPTPAFICGDFNAPQSLMKQMPVDKHAAAFLMKRRGYINSHVGIDHYSTYKDDFKEVLDYILYKAPEQRKIKIKDIMTLPQKKLNMEKWGVPNAIHPSDHLPLTVIFGF